MTDNTWTDSTGNHKAKNPDNWSDGRPQPDDTLLLPQGSTIDVADKDLRGAPLILSGSSSQSPTTLKMSRNAQVSLEKDGSHSPLGEPSNVVANIKGHDTLDLSTVESGFGPTGPLSATVNLAEHSTLSGNFNLGFRSHLTISGDGTSSYINNGTDGLTGATAVFNTDVRGTGTINAFLGGVSFFTNGASSVEFAGFVSGGQSVNLTGAGPFGPLPERDSSVILDEPTRFHGTIDLHDFSFAALARLAAADSWTYNSDMLRIYDTCGQLLDKLKVVSDAATTGGIHGLSVSFNPTSGDLIVKPGTDFSGSLVTPTT